MLSQTGINIAVKSSEDILKKRIRIFFSLTMAVVLIVSCVSCAGVKKPTPTQDEQTPKASKTPKVVQKVDVIDKDVAAEYPFPEELPDTVNGKATFVDKCAVCHGAKGDGKGSEGAADFTSDKFMREARPYLLFTSISEGKEEMPAWKKQLSEHERWNVLYYIFTLHTSEGEIQAGMIAYGTYCGSCHGVQGNGNKAQTNPNGLNPADFTDLKWINGQKDSYLWKAIKYGAGDMPAFNEDLIDEQIWNTVDFIRSFSYGPKRESQH